MRNLVISGLLAAQLAAAPAVAADLIEDRTVASQQTGSFAGARVRVALGGGEERGQLRAGLVMAPTVRTQTGDNREALRFGEGMELGIVGSDRIQLSLAGQDVRRLAAAQDNGDGDDDGGVPTWAIVVGGVVVVLGLGLWGLSEWAEAQSE